MAHVYDNARQYFASGSINLATATIGVTLVNTTLYTFNAGHDFLSNGIKFRNDATYNGAVNYAGHVYVYAAFAHAPFKTANAR